MASSKKIAIVGAGIAGLALAIIATKQGHKVSLFERGGTVSTLGAGVTLWPNAMFVMQQMGLDNALRDRGGLPSMMRQFDPQGILQTEFDILALNALCGLPSVTVLRRDLMDLLLDTVAKLDVKIRFNLSITVADVMKLGREFDLVVGADGRMNSVVRQTLYPGKVTPRYHGFVNIIGLSHRKEFFLDNSISDFRGSGQRFGIVPVNGGKCYWAGAWNAPIDKLRSQNAWFDELYQRFRGWPNPIKDVLQNSDSASMRHIFVHDIDPLPFWHQGNILLIGDAAHASLPTSGQGACQALEDAWHLSLMLEEEDEMASALQKFYRQRCTKTSAAQMVGRQLANKFFSGQPEPLLPATHISAKELSHFWMQGLI